MSMSTIKRTAAIENLKKANAANRLNRPPSMRVCVNCGEQYKCKPSQQSSYCSRACMTAAYRHVLRGENNPNFKDVGADCAQCGERFKNYIKTRKFCSRACYSKSRPKKIKTNVIKFPKPKKIKSAPKPKRVREPRFCIQCSAPFNTYNKTQTYCSYRCHLDSGGGLRAGQASIMARKKYGAKKDANHNKIVDLLRKGGISVRDLSSAGNGVPDILCWHNQRWLFAEIKNLATGYGRRGLNKNQKKWAENWPGGPVFIIKNEDDAINFIRCRFDRIEVFPAGAQLPECEVLPKIKPKKYRVSSVDEARALAEELSK